MVISWQGLVSCLKDLDSKLENFTDAESGASELSILCAIFET